MMLIGDLAGYALQDLVFYLAIVIVWAQGFQAGMHR